MLKYVLFQLKLYLTMVGLFVSSFRKEPQLVGRFTLFLHLLESKRHPLIFSQYLQGDEDIKVKGSYMFGPGFDNTDPYQIKVFKTVSRHLDAPLEKDPFFFFPLRNSATTLHVMSNNLKVLALLKMKMGDISFWELPPLQLTKDQAEQVTYHYGKHQQKF